MRRKTLSLTLAATAVAATAVAVTVIPGVSVATPDTSKPDAVRWGSCSEKAAAPGKADSSSKDASSRLECSTLKVPLDYRDPDGRQIEIAISRLASEKPSKRRGVLLTNPGGPGISGLGYPVALAASKLPQKVQDAYDVIGFDPRGTGRSTPVTCDLTEAQQKRGNLPPYAHTAADVTREAKNARTIAKQCATSKTASMLPHTTTANTARDMDRIREALGEPKASYLGGSYGSYLGAVYTTLFPKRSDRIVLDSNLGPGGYDVTAMRSLARGLEDRFPDFAAFAAAHPKYGLGTTPEQVTAKFFELAKRLEAKPVRGIDATLFRGLTFDRLYSDAEMPLVAEMWQALDKDRPLPPNTPPVLEENSLAARLNVICGDSRWPETVKEYQRNVAVDRQKYPMLGGSAAGIGPCAFWPDKRVEPPVRIGDRGPSNVLMVQNERDPGTPLARAKKLRQAFGKRATMVTADQGGHGVYPFGRNTCANDAVTAFLTSGQRPAQDLACPAEPSE
ncbi:MULTISPECIES: alpha/beta fold hydrolase [unclassified Streptomyces]|uniref:alpha/beta hydrolase n=1 Tax=unclassified Streptomyces TaxID=2593676 RepID=UPI002DD9890E|nr:MULTISPECIES: alpha/beta fold hydrolase [unclassified Streptomyces]WSA96611.1 alpha/beta hydrolase [Streptomyces sp. NBC_01795]WSB81025.1 alpha/beta hydrolase [Streptomyces sp. NBC_01775]WSS10764.1 alpha/beta hydrolase [Streptomyces sp. NBC_01186]WSS39463.1 alpha/beta hydrolase [Streptomyces sp. NBC_01187]